ncbi:jg499, partial [Pararge aegeria aegeria]
PYSHDRGQQCARRLFGGRPLQWARNPDLACPASPSLNGPMRGGVRMLCARAASARYPPHSLVLPRYTPQSRVMPCVGFERAH